MLHDHAAMTDSEEQQIVHYPLYLSKLAVVLHAVHDHNAMADRRTPNSPLPPPPQPLSLLVIALPVS